jgi:hypothetical protein
MSLDSFAPVLRQLARATNHDISIGAAAIQHWSAGILNALVGSKLLAAASPGNALACAGCARGCFMEVTQLGEESFVVCDKPDDFGLIEVLETDRRQWRCTRSQIVTFLSSALDQKPKEADSALNRVRFGISSKLGKPLVLEFSDTAVLVVGNQKYGLSDLLLQAVGRICLDWELLQSLAKSPNVVGSENVRYQPSTAKRDRRKQQTQARDLLLQGAMDQTKSAQPKWNKERCARQVEKATNVSWQRIMRVTRVNK